MLLFIMCQYRVVICTENRAIAKIIDKSWLSFRSKQTLWSFRFEWEQRFSKKISDSSLCMRTARAFSKMLKRLLRWLVNWDLTFDISQWASHSSRQPLFSSPRGPNMSVAVLISLLAAVSWSIQWLNIFSFALPNLLPVIASIALSCLPTALSVASASPIKKKCSTINGFYIFPEQIFFYTQHFFIEQFHVGCTITHEGLHFAHDTFKDILFYLVIGLGEDIKDFVKNIQTFF